MHDYSGVDMAGFVNRYLSREHRDSRADGCTLAALCGDAARQPPAVQAAIESGVATMLAAIDRGSQPPTPAPAPTAPRRLACWPRWWGRAAVTGVLGPFIAV